MKLFNFASAALAVITGLMSPGETSAAEQGGADCGIPETVAVKDATKTARDGGMTSNRTCKFTAELPEEKLETPVVHASVSTAFGTINVVRHAAYGERRNLADEGAGYAASASCCLSMAAAICSITTRGWSPAPARR